MRAKSWKSLLLKVRHLTVELDDHRDVLTQCLPEFDRLVRAAAGETVSPPPPPSEANEPGLVPLKKPEEQPAQPPCGDGAGEIPEVSDEADYPEVARKLWKAIAAITHPDKTGNDPKLTEVYKRAADAWKKREFEVLLDIAFELDIPVAVDANLVPYIQRRSESLVNEIQHIERLAVWHWAHASEEDRQKVVERAAAAYLQIRKATPSS